MSYSEKTISSEIAYSGKILNLKVDKVELQNGRVTTREVVGHSGAVSVVALDGEGNIILVRQFRYPFSRELLEIPAGKLENGEDPLACAVRELGEETGYTASEFTYLGDFYPSAAYCEEIIHIYLARGLSAGSAHPDEGEFIDTVKMPLSELVDMIMDNSVHDAKTIIGVLKAIKFLDLEK